MTNLLFQSHFAHCRSNATAEKWPNLNQKQTSKEAVEKQVLLRGSIYQCKLNFLVVQFIHSLGNCISTQQSNKMANWKEKCSLEIYAIACFMGLQTQYKTTYWGVRYFFQRVGNSHIVHDEYALNQIIGKSNTCLWSSFGSQGLAKSDALICMQYILALHHYAN